MRKTPRKKYPRKRKPDQLFEEACKSCPHIIYGRTERAVRAGIAMHNIKKHGAPRVGLADHSKIIGKPGTLLHYVQNTPDFDFGFVMGHMRAHANKKKEREQREAS